MPLPSLVKTYKILRTYRRTISVEVTFKGEVIIRAPLAMREKEIEAFLEKHSKWIEKKLAMIGDNKTPGENESVYFLGREYKVIIDKEISEPFKFDGAFYFSERYSKVRDEIMKSWLKVEAHNYILPRFIEYAKQYNISFNRITISSASKRWGSCSTKRNVNFSLRLIMTNPKAIEYVIIHELAHLKEMNHSINFWNEVKRMMPDYKDHEKYLRLNSHKFHLP